MKLLHLPHTIYSTNSGEIWKSLEGWSMMALTMNTCLWHPIHKLHCTHQLHVPLVLKSIEWAASSHLFTLRLELYLWWYFYKLMVFLAALVTCIQIIQILMASYLFRNGLIKYKKTRGKKKHHNLFTHWYFVFLHPKKEETCLGSDNAIYLSDGAGRSQLFPIKISWEMGMVLSTMADAIWHHF